MPVLDHATHPSTVIREDFKYGCNGTPRPIENQAIGSRYSGALWPYVFSTDCHYDMSLKDRACDGCQWRGSGEKYDAMIRANLTYPQDSRLSGCSRSS
jgi:hypothetical protein